MPPIQICSMFMACVIFCSIHESNERNIRIMAKNNNAKKTHREEEFQQYRKKVQDQFRSNFEFFLKENSISQKQLAVDLNIIESTISANKNKLNLEFLLRLKMKYPDLSLDNLLFSSITNAPAIVPAAPEPEEAAEYQEDYSDLTSYQGTYFLYYANPNSDHTSLKWGVLYVNGSADQDLSAAKCLAVFSDTSFDDLEKSKKHIDTLDSLDAVRLYIRKRHKNSMYEGTFSLSGSHIIIYLKKMNSRDHVFMIFHRTELSDTQYLGGLGTANSITTSNYQSNNPVIQRIGLSREVILSDPEELLSHLRFQQMDIDFTNESKRLYHTIKKLLRKNEADPNGSQKINDSLDLEIFIPEIIRSNFVKLTKDVLEHNYLYNNQVKSSHDSEWFRIIRDSRNRKEKTIGNTYGNELEEMER